MAGETFKLNFITNGEGIKVINEPSGFDAADFTLKQEDKRLGRDVSFAGGESEFSFYPMRNHEFDLLVYYYETFGWESEVQLIIEIDGFDNVIGDFDFYTATTDLLEEFSCKIVQNKKQALIKKRNDITVDLFDTVDLDDNVIEPIFTENVLIKAKPILQKSKWETSESFNHTFTSSSSSLTSNGETEIHLFNPSRNLTLYGIEDSLTFFNAFEPTIIRNVYQPINKDNFKVILAANNLKNIKIDISNFDFSFYTYENNGNGYVNFKLEVAYGLDYDTSTKHTLFSGQRTEDKTYSNKNDYTYTIPFIERGDSVWLYIHYTIRQSKFGVGTFLVNTTVNTMDVNITATSTSYNTIAPSIRLYDACEKTVEAISQLPISFPFAEPNGEMYNQRIVNGNFLRNILDKPFYISMADIEDWLPEINGDYEVSEDGVYFGKYETYYKNIESGYFETIKFDDYQKAFNEKYAINQFNYKYSKYQSQKEEEVENTYDDVHGESEWFVQNSFVENKKEINVGFVRSAYLIAELQKKALTTSDDTTTTDDDTIFILDTIVSIDDYVFNETDYLQHVYSEDTNYLDLNNDGNFSFTLIGITAGTQFRILGGDANAGTYTVIEVTNRKLTLSGGGSINNNSDRITQFEYIVTKETAPYKIWGNENFSVIDEIINTEDYANLKYSIKRNIVRFYNQYLATCNLYANKVIKNTLYKNNPDAILNYDGLLTVEGESFLPTNPILSPYKHTITLITDFATYKNLENKIRSERGYIRIWDKNDFILKVYPSEMTFVNSGDLGELTIVGEEKYETSLINIIKADLGYLIINDYYRTTKINFKQKGEKFYIFDEMNRLLFRPTFWQKITINNANATNKENLIEWLTLIS
jgi:hypothetical protein